MQRLDRMQRIAVRAGARERRRDFVADQARLADAGETTVNTVLAYLCGSSLRRFFKEYNALPEESLIGMLPVSLQERSSAVRGNAITGLRVALGTHIGDPLAASGIPLAITPGNHDASRFPQFALERKHFEKQWQDRHSGLDILPGSEWPWRYAARMGSTLLVSFDGTMPGKLSKSELAFVADMLQNYRSEAAAVIVFSHLPMWPIAKRAWFTAGSGLEKTEPSKPG